jgi:hypothetical protein
MAMHKPKKIKRFQPGGLVDSEGRPVRDGSGQPIMTGSGREEAETQKRMQAAEAKLAGEVQDMVKARSDSERMSKDAEEGAKAPATSVKMPTRPGQGATSAKMPTRPGQGAKPKSGIVTKEELEKSGLSLRDYMNKQRGLTRRDGAAPKSKTTSPAVSSSYRSEGAGRAKPPASSGSASSTTPAAPEKRPGTALPINPGILKQREADEKKRDAARAAKRKENEAKEEKFTKDLRSDPGQMAIRKEREAAKSMSPSERSAARGKAVKEFFGINTKKPLDAKGATIQSMDTDMMRAAGRTAAKEQGQKRKVESSYKKGGSVSSASKRADGIAQRGKTRGKVY